MEIYPLLSVSSYARPFIEALLEPCLLHAELFLDIGANISTVDLPSIEGNRFMVLELVFFFTIDIEVRLTNNGQRIYSSSSQLT